MEFWIKASQLILSLSILIFVHELGHFLPARFFKIRVEKFYLFFNPWFSLVKKKFGDTEWGIGWIPLGGYVKIAGMIDESMDKEQMAQPVQDWEFRSKPAWQRLIVMLGGVTVNIIVGIFIYMMVVLAWGEDQIHTKDLDHGLAIHPFMAQYDLHSGDNILAINGVDVVNPNNISKGIMIRDEYNLKVQRPDGTIKNIVLPDGIEYKMFAEGAMNAFGLRNKSTGVQHIMTDNSITANGEELIPSGSAVIAIDKKNIKEFALGTTSKDFETKKSVQVQYTTMKDTATVISVIVPKAQVKSLFAAMPAFRSGLRPGDKFLTLDGKNITYFDQITDACYENKGKAITATVLRGSDTITLTPKVSKLGTIGYATNQVKPQDEKHLRHIDYGFGACIGRGFTLGMETLGDYAGQLKFLFTKKGASSVGGFGAIGSLFSPTWDWQSFWANTALISIILAFMNILPIPALDGGHVVFLLYEIITGKEAPQKVLEYAQTVGFFLLIALLLYANGNDIYRAIFG